MNIRIIPTEASSIIVVLPIHPTEGESSCVTVHTTHAHCTPRHFALISVGATLVVVGVAGVAGVIAIVTTRTRVGKDAKGVIAIVTCCAIGDGTARTAALAVEGVDDVAGW